VLFTSLFNRAEGSRIATRSSDSQPARAPRFSGTWSLITLFAALVRSTGMAISSVSLWPLARIWHYFMIPLDDSRKGLTGFLVISVNVFSGAEFAEFSCNLQIV
jgi:hypothetical protein